MCLLVMGDGRKGWLGNSLFLPLLPLLDFSAIWHFKQDYMTVIKLIQNKV